MAAPTISPRKRVASGVLRLAARQRQRAFAALHAHPRLDGLAGRVVPRRFRPRPPRADDHADALFDLRRFRPVHAPASHGGALSLSARSQITDAVRSRARRADVVRVPADWLSGPATLRALLELAATGAPVELDGPVPPDALLDEDLAEVFAPTDRMADRTLRSVRVRRAAIEAHRRSSPRPTPAISVVLSSHRPADLATAIEQVACQRAVDIQLLVGLHGDQWDPKTESEIRGQWTGALEILRRPASSPLGAVLGELSSFADGDLISKWDDDDFYGADHLADLHAAWRYSGAELVGKFAEFVYLEESNLTVRRAPVGSETYGGPLAGGTLLTEPDWLREVGGWGNAPRSVDQRLISATLRASGTTYRTHGFQYLLRRRSTTGNHTWWAPDEYFTSNAIEIERGLQPWLADLGSLDDVPPSQE